MNDKTQNYALINMDDVISKDVDWLFYPYIPYGKMTIVQGDPGEGKTTFVLHLAALLSIGAPLPCQTQENEPINILYQTAEDGLADTIKPRLEVAAADCSRIIVIDESCKQLSLDDERIEKAIVDTQARLIVFDPIQAYIGAELNMNSANQTRPILQNLAVIAERHNCAIILIGHMNKTGSSQAIYRSLGSIDIVGAVRSVLLVSRLKDQPTLRVVAHCKSNLAPQGDSFAFELDKIKGFQWVGRYDITAEELLSGVHRESKIRKAELFLQEELSTGSKPQKELQQKAIELDISKRTLDSAKSRLKIGSFKDAKGWRWTLRA